MIVIDQNVYHNLFYNITLLKFSVINSVNLTMFTTECNTFLVLTDGHFPGCNALSLQIVGELREERAGMNKFLIVGFGKVRMPLALSFISYTQISK